MLLQFVLCTNFINYIISDIKWSYIKIEQKTFVVSEDAKIYFKCLKWVQIY